MHSQHCASVMSKQKWPELVGKPWKEAEEALRRDYHNLCIQILPMGSMVTKDYHTDRVRVFIHADGTVAIIPRIG